MRLGWKKNNRMAKTYLRINKPQTGRMVRHRETSGVHGQGATALSL
jgi:hypothetical protein